MVTEQKFPTEVIDLPSEGYFYDKNNPLSGGTVELRYMGAKEEDILTSANLIKRGLAIDMVLKSVIASPINYDDLLVGDKNSIMVVTRVLAYGKDYQFEVTCPSCGRKSKHVVDLSALSHKEIDFTKFAPGVNEFTFVLPNSKRELTFKFLTSGDELEIDAEIKGLKRAKEGIPNTQPISNDLSTRLKKIITSVDGKREKKAIWSFVDNELLSRDSLALRTHIAEIQPDVDMTFDFICPSIDECDYQEKVRIPLTVEFFWPTGK